MDDRLFHLMDTLESVRETLGERVFVEAIALANKGVGVAAFREAERRAASLGIEKRSGNIIPFPLGRAAQPK